MSDQDGEERPLDSFEQEQLELEAKNEKNNIAPTGITLEQFMISCKDQKTIEPPSPTELQQLLDKLLARCTIPRRPDVDTKCEKNEEKEKAVSLWARELFEITNFTQLRWKDLEHHYDKQMLIIARLKVYFTSYNMLGYETAQEIINLKKFQKIYESLYQCRDLLNAEYRLCRISDPDDDGSVPEELSLFRYSPLQFDQNTPCMNLILYLLRIIAEKNYKRKGDKCYEQLMIEIEVADSIPKKKKVKQFATHAWKEKCSISDFIYTYTKMERNARQWTNLMKGRGNHSFALEYLSKGNLSEFQDLKPTRYVFAFENGLFDANACAFYSYGSTEIDPNVVAAKYFPLKFETEKYMEYMKPYFQEPLPNETNEEKEKREKKQLEAWYDVPTPLFQSILDHQRFGRKEGSEEYDHQRHKDVCKVLYGSMGRLFFEVGQNDNWEVIFFIKGVAQSGKSTIGKICRNFYTPADVAILANNIENKFGLGAIKDKLMYLCLEVKHNFGLDQADFQSMISGEDMSIPMKFKAAETIIWVVPGYLLGNEAANWLDASGSIGRRLPVFEFNTPVLQSDPDLYKKIVSIEMAPLMFKCAMAYFEMRETYKGRGIWNCLPAYFAETKKRMALQISPLMEFLHSDQVKLDASRYMPLQNLLIRFKKWLRENKNGKMDTAITADTMRTPFSSCGISVRKTGLDWLDETTGSVRKIIQVYALGVGLRMPEDDQLEMNNNNNEEKKQ